MQKFALDLALKFKINSTNKFGASESITHTNYFSLRAMHVRKPLYGLLYIPEF